MNLNREWPGVPPTDDDDYRQRYPARVRGEVDDQTWFSYIRSRKSATST